MKGKVKYYAIYTSVMKVYTTYRVLMFSIWILSLQNSHTGNFRGLDTNPASPRPISRSDLRYHYAEKTGFGVSLIQNQFDCC